MKRDLSRLRERTFDAVVVGGGIGGVTLAAEMTALGYTVALVERGDFGSATSSNSQRMLHGGVRYLQSLNVLRALRSARARRDWIRRAPHLVRPVPILMPVYRGQKHGRFVLRSGMTAFDLMSWRRNGQVPPEGRIPRHRTLSRRRCLEAAPQIRTEGLRGAVVFWDAMARNTERLTLGYATQAARGGAVLANYAEVRSLLQESGGVRGVLVRDVLSGEELEVAARLVLNAAGPWAGALAGEREPLVRVMALLTRPVHDRYALAVTGGERLFYATPWRHGTLVGTEETPVSGDPSGAVLEQQDVESYLEAFNAALPGAHLGLEDVQRVFWGFQPAAANDPRRVSRRDRLVVHEEPKGLVSAVGIKFTTAPWLARKAARRAAALLGTGAGAEPVDPPAATEVPGMWAGHLRGLYGRDAGRVAACIQDGDVPVSVDPLVLPAEVRYGLRHEMAQTLRDIVFRRTELGALGAPAPAALETCAALAGEEAGWSAERRRDEVAAVNAAFAWPLRGP